MQKSLYQKLCDLESNMIIAIDGPAGSGKGSVGTMLSEKYNMFFFPSGTLYRQIAFSIKDNKIDYFDENFWQKYEIKNLDKIDPNLLQTEEIGKIASQIATAPTLRAKIKNYQRKIINMHPRIVMEGRDTGTIIAPNADLKIFLYASASVRARRRSMQLGVESQYEKILEQIKIRDKIDKNRHVAPLIPAKDALQIDSSDLNLEQIIEKVSEFCQKVM